MGLNYMAIDAEGRFVAVITDRHPNEIAREVSKWIKQGLEIDRCDNEYVRNNFGDIVKEKQK